MTENIELNDDHEDQSSNCVYVCLKVTLGKIILSHQNETNLLTFGHGGNSESRPNAIFPFSCSSRHDSL